MSQTDAGAGFQTLKPIQAIEEVAEVGPVRLTANFGAALSRQETPPNAEELSAFGAGAQSHLVRAREINTGAGAPAADLESIHSHLREAYILAQQQVFQKSSGFSSGYEYLGTVSGDSRLFEAMGTTSQEYHGLLRDADLRAARVSYERAVELTSGGQSGYEMLNRSIQAYKDAALHDGFAQQTVPLDRQAAEKGQTASLKPLLEADGLSIASLREFRQVEGFKEIQRILSDAHTVDTREHDLEAARNIDGILRTTGLTLNSPELQANNIDAEEIQDLRATSFGESMRGFVSAMVPSFMK